MGKAFQKVFDGITAVGKKVFGGLKDGLMGLFDGDDGSDGFFASLKDKFSGLFGDAEGDAEGFFGKVKNKVKGMFGGGGAPEPPGPLKADGTPDMRFKANKRSCFTKCT